MLPNGHMSIMCSGLTERNTDHIRDKMTKSAIFLLSHLYQYMDIFNNLIRILSSENTGLGHQSHAATGVKEKSSIQVPVKFKSDVETLQRLYPGSTEILLDLREALQILPRDRKRSDAYKALQVWLGENLGINLVIKSQKRK
jgi:hypothetical protein